MTMRGVLALADISGYTRYLSGVELEHSTDVLADLMGEIVRSMAGRFELVKLEGDAVFVHSLDPTASGESFVAAIESAHLAFHDRARNIRLATTCPCAACARIVDLGLKFVVHHGEYSSHSIAGLHELVGEEVVRVHRLLKNRVQLEHQVGDYALFTESFIRHFGLEEVPAMFDHTESTDDVGTIRCSILDLGARLKASRDARVVVVTADEEGVIELPLEVDVAPAVAWDYAVSPDKQVLWLADEERHESADGLPGRGMRTHCVHGDVALDHEIVDWRPYEYLTYRSITPAGRFLTTDSFEPTDDGRRTRLVMRSRPDGPREQSAVADQHMQWLSAEILRGRLKLVEVLAQVARREP